MRAPHWPQVTLEDLKPIQVRRPLNFSERVRRVAKILRGAFREPLKSGSRGPESAKIWPPGAKFRSPPAAAHVTSAVASAFHSSASDRTPLPLTPPPLTSPSDASIRQLDACMAAPRPTPSPSRSRLLVSIHPHRRSTSKLGGAAAVCGREGGVRRAAGQGEGAYGWRDGSREEC